MAHLWIHKKKSTCWAIASLDGDANGSNGHAFILTGNPDNPVILRRKGMNNQVSAYIIRHSEQNGRERWILYASPEAQVSINGTRMLLGMRLLRDKDEIVIGQLDPVYFSMERLARTEKFPGLGKPAQCPRCQKVISVGQLSVKCPNCGVWHHQLETLNCWTYSPKCTLCDYDTTAQTFRWTPEDL